MAKTQKFNFEVGRKYTLVDARARAREGETSVQNIGDLEAVYLGNFKTLVGDITIHRFGTKPLAVDVRDAYHHYTVSEVKIRGVDGARISRNPDSVYNFEVVSEADAFNSKHRKQIRDDIEVIARAA